MTLPAAGIRADALAFLLWETSWRGMSTVQQTSIPALHVQTLTVKWWVSLPEWLRFGSAAHLAARSFELCGKSASILAVRGRAHEAVRILFLRSAPGVH